MEKRFVGKQLKWKGYQREANEQKTFAREMTKNIKSIQSYVFVVSLVWTA